MVHFGFGTFADFQHRIFVNVSKPVTISDYEVSSKWITFIEADTSPDPCSIEETRATIMSQTL